MKSPTLQTIEKQLSLLSQDEQLWLIAHLAQQVRRRQQTTPWPADIDAMVSDPQIQKELREIENEFSSTEEDGLEGL